MLVLICLLLSTEIYMFMSRLVTLKYVLKYLLFVYKFMYFQVDLNIPFDKPKNASKQKIIKYPLSILDASK